MANTGTKIVLTLKEVIVPGDIPTGNTKSNVVGDPDYIAPYVDTSACPITTDLTCPTMAATGGSGSIEYEIYVPTTVTANPMVAKVKVKVMDSTGTTLETSETILLPFSPEPNYYTNTITGITAGTHVLAAEYLNSSDVIQATCNNIVTGITTT